MAQSALTVTLPNPTPPTNFVFVGSTPPDPLNYDPAVYGPPPNPASAPFFDDGVAASPTVFAANHAALPQSGTSIPHEGAGTEVVYTAPGSVATAPSVSVGVGPAATDATREAGPNANHPSCLSVPGAVPLITQLSPGGVHGTGTTLLTIDGLTFNRGSTVTIGGVLQTTNLPSANQLTVANAVKKPTAGNLPVIVTTNGVPSLPVNWVFT